MSLPEFAVEVILISSSGVLSPGPLFFANLLYGSKYGIMSGIRMAHGHSVIELPLIILLSVGLASAVAIEHLTDVIGIIGGSGILAFAAFQLINLARKRKIELTGPAKNRKSSFITGIALTALNPFFLVWWFTIGLKLVSDSYAFGAIAGIAILFSLHIWMDYAWLALTAHLASKGVSILKSKYYPIIILGISITLIYYGITFVTSALG